MVLFTAIKQTVANFLWPFFFFLLWCDPKNKAILFFNLYFILLSILSNIIFIFKISLWFHFYLLFNFSGTASQTSFSSISWVLTSTCLLALTRYFNCNLTFLLKLPMLWVLRERTKGRCTTFIILCRIYALSIAIVAITLEFMVLLINTPREEYFIFQSPYVLRLWIIT